MHNSPDHDQPRFGDFGDTRPELMEPATRLSVLAIASLVTGILALPICCVPVGGSLFGLVPIGCGIGGLRAAKRSRGRVAGRGLAIAGLVMGLLGTIASTLFWAVIAGQFAKMPAVYAQVLDPDPAVVRTLLTSSAGAGLTDPQIAAFREAFVADHGERWTAPVGAWPVLKSYGRIGDPTLLTSAPAGPTQRAIPVPLETDTGWTYIVVLVRQGETLGSGLPAVADVGFQAADGTVRWLSEVQIPAESQSPTTGAADEGPGAPPLGAADPDPGG